ncbi:YetF domain-containing protein [Lysinibacillus sp. LZ02]|uniref:YetF domain-containing protein n=1 Tax=Lysinibacillus sp. LZ02 TaxID=3420668 RepID=UPI003D3679DF
MEINVVEMLLRTTGAFFAILFLARIIGKKQLSQLTFFHYITGITFGSIASEIAAQAETPFWDGFIALIWWGVLTLLISYLSLKSVKLRTLFDDKPTIIIQNGTILPKNLKKARLSLDELLMLLREQSVFSAAEVDYAVFETNGELSIMKKVAVSNATKQDVKANTAPAQYVPMEVICDGKIISKNLIELNLTEDWLMKKLKKKNITSAEDVFLAQVLEDGSLYVSKKQNAPLNLPS